VSADIPARIWVLTCAHRGDDARILHRQIRSLLTAGLHVTLVAPDPPPESLTVDPEGLQRVVVPRARGRRRLRSHLAVARALRGALRSQSVDLVIVHDPELLPIVLGLTWRRPSTRSSSRSSSRSSLPVVWDVHEDFVASVNDRSYVPEWARPLLRHILIRIESIARRRCQILLAEDSYRDRLGDHPVVSNATWVPEPDTLPLDLILGSSGLPRVLYAGRISRSRGVIEMIEIAQCLRGVVEMHLIGEPDADVADLVAEAHANGAIIAHGYVANPAAMAEIPGALAGLSLLADIANYRGSRPTKLIEYLAHQVPVISTPLPVAAALVTDSGGGVIVEWNQIVEHTVAQITAWVNDPEAARTLGLTGYQFVREHHSWQAEEQRFVDLIRAAVS
jgi:glycosyltransferase involved in cell wall biosynthesis